MLSSVRSPSRITVTIVSVLLKRRRAEFCAVSPLEDRLDCGMTTGSVGAGRADGVLAVGGDGVL